MNHTLLIVPCVLLMSHVAGCAPARFIEGISHAAQKYHCRDASTLCVAERGHLRFDTRLRSDLEDAISLADVDELKSEGDRTLRAAHALAIQASGGEIDRMSREGTEFLLKKYHHEPAGADMTEQRKLLKNKYARESRAALEVDLAILHAADGPRAARNILRRIHSKIEKPVGDRGRLGRVLLTAPLFLPASIGAQIVDAKAAQHAVVADFEHVFIYRPGNTRRVRTVSHLQSADYGLLAHWYAPVFIQQTDPEAPYAASEDQFGRVYLSGAPERIQVNVDIDDPVIYWTHRQAKIGARTYGQLVYVAWYPSRPALKTGDSEAGHIDGVIVRITLDSHSRPAIYEFVRSCGCYHMLWVAEFVEASARRHYGRPVTGKQYAIERAGSRRELFLPWLVQDDGSHPSRPVTHISAGHHLLLGIEAGGDWEEQGNVVSERSYRLLPYQTLTALPLAEGVASMFGSDGLVHGAGRAEGWLLAPTGMRSAGQPRQLGTMKIRMDAYDYDDPRLLERQLRFPPDF